MSYVWAFVTLYQRECLGTVVFRVTSEEEKDILDAPILRSPLFSQGDMGLSDLFDDTGSSP